MEGKDTEIFNNKQVTVFYDDSGSVSRKDGICIRYISENGILLQTEKNKQMFIPKDRIIRVECVT